MNNYIKRFSTIAEDHSRHILLVEDSSSVASLLRHLLQKSNFEVHVCQSKKETTELLASSDCPPFFAAILDLQLHDSKDDSVIDLVLSYQIPCMVLTGVTDSEVRNRISKKNIVNYFSKKSFEEVKYAIEAVARLGRNLSKKALVVDDSETSRQLISGILANQLIDSYQVSNAEEALSTLAEHPEINLVFIDHYLPGMNGDDLTIKLRKTNPRKELVIMAVSKRSDSDTIARFLKLGANDFISKPFSLEEFLCRINMNLDNLDLIQSIMQLAHKDYLSNLANRRFFMEEAAERIKNFKEQGLGYAIVMMDIDHFKNINDTWGHKTGDLVIEKVARIFRDNTKGADLVSRYGGEEFCFLLADIDAQGAYSLSEKIRNIVSQTEISILEQSFHFTISAGICCDMQLDFEAMINQADKMLYQAKENGRNQVVIATIPPGQTVA